MADDANLRAPIAHLNGTKPAAPAWFDAALGRGPERRMVDVDGTAIESLSWGERGKQGLLFLHGNGAHADWWSFIAPFFADDYRVAALSWSGMGGSGHRERYSLDNFIAQAFAVAEAEGLFDGPAKPIFVAHSFGGFVLAGAMAARGNELAGGVIVDTPVRTAEEEAERRNAGPRREGARPHRVYATLEEALARFRFAPEQPCDNLYIADFIARTSLRQVEGGWAWKFDPFLWSDFDISDPTPLVRGARCPQALIWGDRSRLMPPETVAHMRTLFAADAPFMPVPDAAHHVMIDQPLAFVTLLRGLFARWP